MCLRSQFADSDYVCFTGGDLNNLTLQATEVYSFVTEPQDPKFYSSCFSKTIGLGFNNYPSYPRPIAGWEAGDLCVPCQFLSNTNTLNNHTAPNWENISYQNGYCTPCY